MSMTDDHLPLRESCACTPTVFPCVACLAYAGGSKQGLRSSRGQGRRPRFASHQRAVQLLRQRPLSSAELAPLLGLTRSNLTRVLTDLREQGQIESLQRGQGRVWAILQTHTTQEK